MATPSSLNIYRAPGTLIANPANSTGPDYGGTVLGSIDRVQFDTGIRYAKAYYDEMGRTGEIIQVQKDALFRLAVRGWDDDALSRFFPSFASGVTSIGSTTETLSASKGSSYLWAANDVEHPSILILNAVPMIEANEQSLRWSLRHELNVYVNFHALPLSLGDPLCAKIGLVGDLL